MWDLIQLYSEVLPQALPQQVKTGQVLFHDVEMEVEEIWETLGEDKGLKVFKRQWQYFN